MAYGKLSPASEGILRGFVEGKRVLDLGAGLSAPHSGRLIALGAVSVVAVDKEFDEGLANAVPDGGIRYVQARFAQFDRDTGREAFDVSFLSWPSNWENPGLVPLLRRSRTVVYLGKNTDGSACGTPGLFRYFTGRELLAEDSRVENTMLVYGAELGAPRRPAAEEIAGAMDAEPGETSYGTVWSYEPISFLRSVELAADPAGGP